MAAVNSRYATSLSTDSAKPRETAFGRRSTCLSGLDRAVARLRYAVCRTQNPKCRSAHGGLGQRAAGTLRSPTPSGQVKLVPFLKVEERLDRHASIADSSEHASRRAVIIIRGAEREQKPSTRGSLCSIFALLEPCVLFCTLITVDFDSDGSNISRGA